MKHPDAYLTTLVHELAHAFAYRFNIHSYIVEFEEDFTDMLCVYLGLGDVMLNGCVSMSTTEKWCGCYVERYYERLKVGYLTPLSLAAAEVIMQEMTRGFDKQRKCFNPRAYSMLTDVRIWLDFNQIDFRNKKYASPEQYLQRIRTQLETLKS